MKPIVVLDTGPLGLLFQKPHLKEAEVCRQWVRGLLKQSVRIVVPEIANYELRRELLRIPKPSAVQALDVFIAGDGGRLLAIDTQAMNLAAELWAKLRQDGFPTADPQALDGDVILAAQILSAGFAPDDFVVATKNVAHLSRFVPAEEWSKI